MGAAQNSPTDLTSLAVDGDYTPDRRRKQLLWLALSLAGVLGLAFVLLVAYGQEITTADYSEPLLLIGLLAFLACTVAYFADKEREQRAQNRSLIDQLHDTARALDARISRLNKLCETSVHLAGTLDIERISELVVEALVAQVQADAASLVLLDNSKGECIHTRSAGLLGPSDGGPDDPVAAAKAAAKTGPSIRCLHDAPEIGHRLRTWDQIRATISAPMKVSDVVSGSLAATRQATFDTEDLNLLTTLANMASKAIESAELHQQLRQSYFRTLHALVRSLAARDFYSAAHGEAVTWLALRLAERLGLGERAAEALEAYCPLHDLGKIGIADAVLLKRGPLTEEELDTCHQHTLIGQDIVQPLNPGPSALAMIRSHHEWWDGSGYPDGLKGEEIPLLARVVTVADAFHAIVSNRPYRRGAIPLAAVLQIQALAGTQFDPTVVEALTDLWEHGELADFDARSGQSTESPHILNPVSSRAAPGFSLH